MSVLTAVTHKGVSTQAQDGWSAELNCTFEPGPDRTIVRRTHSGPLYMQRPFYPEGSIAHVYLLHPPGGVVSGDELRICVSSVNGGRGLVSTPGATKFYRSDGLFATVNQRLEAKGGSLEWLPAENIFFEQSKAKIRTEIRLNSDDYLAWWEINCFGRQACNEAYEHGSICSVVNLFIDDKLILRERLVVNEQRPLSMSCGMRNNRVSGTLVLTPVREYSVDYVRGLVAAHSGFSTTWFDSILIVRYLGDSSEDAKSGFSSIWSGLRTALGSVSPIVPRIWAT